LSHRDASQMVTEQQVLNPDQPLIFNPALSWLAAAKTLVITQALSKRIQIGIKNHTTIIECALIYIHRKLSIQLSGVRTAPMKLW
jgi:hypothetical protein